MYCLCRSQWPRGLRCRSAAARLLRLWVRIPPGHGYLSLVSVVCYQVEVSATSWSLVQRSPTDRVASLCVIQKPHEWGGHTLHWLAAPKKNVLFVRKCVLPPGDNPTSVNKYILSCIVWPALYNQMLKATFCSTQKNLWNFSLPHYRGDEIPLTDTGFEICHVCLASPHHLNQILTHWGQGHLNCLNARSRGF
jgi:hypothetical protein